MLANKNISNSDSECVATANERKQTSTTDMSRNGYVPKRLCPEVAMSRNGYVPKRPAPTSAAAMPVAPSNRCFDRFDDYTTSMMAGLRGCAAIGCNNTRCNSEVRFFRFPNEKDRDRYILIVSSMKVLYHKG